MTAAPARSASPFVSLFGAYRPDGDGAPRPLVVDLFGPRALSRPRRLLFPAVVRAEGLVVEAAATASLAIRSGGLDCHVSFRDGDGRMWRIVLRAAALAACLRARTELQGFLEVAEDGTAERSGSVLLRLNWRAMRLKR